MKELDFRLIVEVVNQYSLVLKEACRDFIELHTVGTKEDKRLELAIHSHSEFQRASGMFSVLHLIACILNEREFSEKYLCHLEEEIREQYGVPDDAMSELYKFILNKGDEEE